MSWVTRKSLAVPWDARKIHPSTGLLLYELDVEETLGRFALARRIGAGSSGEVYAAQDADDLGRALALKRLLRVDGDGIHQLKTEFRALTDLVHPNLVRLYELIEHEREWLVTMELVDGEDFFAWTRPGGALDRARLEHAVAGVAAGLEALHATGRVHRDLKPSNVRITPSGRVVILDFGLAAALSGQPAPKPKVTGTPAYMSPEQARGRKLGPASDAYALGVMMYEALVGELPFAGSALEQLLARLHGVPSFPPALEVPERLARACLGLLEPDPHRRLRLSCALALMGVPLEVPDVRPQVPFVGRGAELAALEAALADARDHAVVVDVQGASGSGKTALVEAFLARAQARGARVVGGRCYERAHVPYEAVDAVVDALADQLAPLVAPADAAALARVFPVLARGMVPPPSVTPAPGTLALAGAATSGPPLPSLAASMVPPPLPSLAASMVPPPLPPSSRSATPLVTSLSASVARDQDDGREVRARAFAALRSLLAQLAADTPLVVFIDDLQWGDVDGAALLGSLVRPPDAPRMLVITGARAEEAATSASVRAWVAARAPADVRPLAVGPLPPEDARALARSLLAPDDPRVEALAHDSAGSPFLLTELARARPSSPPVTSIGDAVRARAAALPAAARAILEALAVARGPIEQGVAALAAGVPDGPDVIARLRAEQLARTSGHGPRAAVETYHDRVREAVEEGLGAERRRHLHRALAEALEAWGDASPERLAEHFEAAGLRSRAAAHAVRAAEGAMQALAFERAAQSFAHALALSDEGAAADRAALEIGQAAALASAGRGAESAQAFLRAAAGAPELEALELRRRAAEQLLAGGHIDEGLEVIDPVLQYTGLTLPRTARQAVMSWLVGRARLRLRGLRLAAPPPVPDARGDLRADACWTLTLGLNAVDMVRSADFATRGLIAALDSGDRARAGRALAYEAATSAFLGSRARAADVLETLARLAEGDAYLTAQWHLVGGLVEAFTSGDWAVAQAHYAQAEAGLTDTHPGAIRDRAVLALVGSWASFYRGDLAELRRRVPILSASARARHDRYAETSLTNAATWVLLAGDAPDAARAEVEQRLAAWTARGFHLQHYVALIAQTHVDRYAGDGARAWRRWGELWPALEASEMLRITNNGLVAHYERGTTALTVLEQPGARACALQDARTLVRMGAGWALPFAAVIRAGVAWADGEPARAVALCREAAGGFDAADMPLYAASARHAAARLRGDEEGQRAAEEELRARGVEAPARWAAMMIPV